VASHRAAGAALDRLIRHLGGEPSRDARLTEKLLNVLALDHHVGVELRRRHEVGLLDLDQAVRRQMRDIAGLIREGAPPRA
jgi:hypothetical protein